MSDTPETDAAASPRWQADGIKGVLVVPLEKAQELERRLISMTQERDEALKWKNEDPRMLREQIRVADVAFNALTARNNQAEAERDKARAMVSVAQAFVNRIESIHNDQHYQSVWIEYANHGGDYTHGPKYDKELAALKDALARLDEMEKEKEANE